MDPISKALERAQTEKKPSVRKWVRPERKSEQNEGAAGASGASRASGARRVSDLEPGALRTVDFDPDILRRNHILCGDDYDDPVIRDRYRVLRTRVTQLMRPNGWKTLGITSPDAKAGKTLTAINLCMSLARDSSNEVVLLDADLRKSSLAQDLGVEVEYSIVDYLQDPELSVEDVLIQSESMPNLRFMPGRRDASRAHPELLSSRRMRELIAQLREYSDAAIMVVDLPPVFVGDDVISLAPSLDCFLLMVDETKTKSDELTEAAQLLAGHNLLGTVLNKSESRGRTFEGYYQNGKA